MSPRNSARPAPRAAALADRLALELGRELRDARLRRAWTLLEVARRAGPAPRAVAPPAAARGARGGRRVGGGGGGSSGRGSRISTSGRRASGRTRARPR